MEQAAANVRIDNLHQQLERMNVTLAESIDVDRSPSEAGQNDQTFDFTPDQLNVSQFNNNSSNFKPNFITTRY